MTDPNLPLHKADRAAIQMILDHHLEKHMEYEQDYVTTNPYSIDRKGLEQSLIAYCATIREMLQ